MTVNVSSSDTFAYVPPALVQPRLVVLKPNWGYPYPPPVTVRVALVQRVVAPWREHYPDVRIMVIEGVCHKLPAADIFRRLGADRLVGAELADAETLPLASYPNLHAQAHRFSEISAPALLQEADACISIGACKRTVLKGQPLFSASTKNLYGLLPRHKYRGRSPYARGQLHLPDVDRVVCDIYGCLGHLFSAVVDAHVKLENDDWQPDRGKAITLGKVVQGESCVDADVAAASLAHEPIPHYAALIAEQRSAS